MKSILFAALLCSGVAWAQNPNVPVAQNALGTIGYYANSGSGTAINKIVTLTGAPSKVVTITAGATSGAIGIVAGGAGTTGNATVQITGYNVPCVFDGATTAGHYVSISASVNGDCTDAGATAPSSQSLGFVLSTNASAGTYKIDMTGSGSGGGGPVGPAGPTGPAGAGYLATSATSLVIATGSTMFTTQAGLAYTAGALSYAVVCSSAAPTACFYGNVTSYSGTTLVVNVTSTSGSGTHADWLISVSGATGPSGPTGAAGGALSGIAPQIYALSSTGATEALPQVYNVQAYGWLPDDTDRSTQMQAVLAAACPSGVGGGTIYFPASTTAYRADSQIFPALTAGNVSCNLRFTGDGGGPAWQRGPANTTASILDLRYQGSGGGKFEFQGATGYEIDHLSITDGSTAPSFTAGSGLSNIVVTSNSAVATFSTTLSNGNYVGAWWVITASTTSALNGLYTITAQTSNTLTFTTAGVADGTYTAGPVVMTFSAPLIHSTRPVPNIHDNAFIGNSIAEDYIQLGGNSISGTGVNAPFNGYSANAVHDNSFTGGNGVLIGAFGNSIGVQNNTWVRGNGGIFAGIRCYGPDSANDGDNFNFNLFEMDSMAEGILLNACSVTNMIGNSFWDDGGNTNLVSYIRLTRSSNQAKVKNAYAASPAKQFSDDDGGQLIAETQIDPTGLTWGLTLGTAQAQAITTYAQTQLSDGQSFCWRPGAANTATAPTLAVDNTTAKVIVKDPNSTALVANDLITTQNACVTYNATAGHYELLNPATASSGLGDPGSNGIVKRTGLNTTAVAVAGTDYIGATTGSAVQKASSGGLTAATSTDVVSLFSTCSGTQYLGADGSCHTSSALTNIDPSSVATFVDEFLCCAQYASSTNFIGIGWNYHNTTGSGSISNSAIQSGYPGQIALSTGATAANEEQLSLSTAAFFKLSGTTFDSYFIVAPTTTLANGEWCFGFTTGSNCLITASSDQIAIRYIGGTDTNWTYQTCTAGTCTTGSLSIAPVLNHYTKFEIKSTVAGTILFYVGGVLEATVSTDVPSSGNYLLPMMDVLTQATGAATLNIDYFALQIAVTR